ncbi:Ig-like domain-containing protein [Methanobacterium sp. SMA-27]|uniref:Ig-like domain-containing protein n=1 Tax=Methanobacterium sp. SMA-27 TaxID=1495336 RepID=UPI00064E509A|nr:Ig-like domain-containing protein [Methanobacterium sp. SMA-27]
MANKLQNRMNVVFEVDAYNGTLNIGDIVQYKDNNNYYRYVTVNYTINDTVVLQGENHQLLSIPKQQADDRILYMLKPYRAVDSYDVVDAAYDVQYEDITQQKVDANNKQNQARKLGTAYISLLSAAGICAFIVITCILIMALLSILSCVSLGTLNFATGIILAISLTVLAIGVGCGIAGGILLHSCTNMKNDANKMEAAAEADLNDLNNFLRLSVHVPIANNMSLNTTGNKTLNGVFNATDADGLSFDAIVVSGPEHGNITVNGTKFVYTPFNDYVGNDTFRYYVIDQIGMLSKFATVNIQVKEKNVVAENMSINTTSNKPWEGVFNVTNAEGDMLNAIVVTAPEHGNLTIHGTKFVYTPANGYLGNDTFSYTVKDNTSSLYNIAIVNIQVKALNILGNTFISSKYNGNNLNILSVFIPLFSSTTKQM